MRHEGKHFSEVDITLDENEFYNCSFERCNLDYFGGITDIQGCSFNDMNRLNFEGAADKTLRFMKLIYHLGFTEFIEAVVETEIRGKAEPAFRNRGLW
jgi:hypothetical protein